MKRYIKSSQYISASFSPDIPDWLLKRINMRGWNNLKNGLINIGVKLDTVTFSDHDNGNSMPIYLIESDYGLEVYAPGCNDSEYTRINGRNRELGSLGKAALKDRIVDVVYIDRNDPNNFDRTSDYKRYRDPRFVYRRDDKKGYYGGQRKKDNGQWTESGDNWIGYRDKSGYVIPRPEDKIREYYRRVPENMTKKVDSLYDSIMELQQDIFSPERINDPNTGSDYGNAMYRLRDAIDAYKRLLKIIDRETGEFKHNDWGSEYNVDSFANAVNEVRKSIKYAKENLAGSRW